MIKELCKRALNELRLFPNFPKHGFIAGGSIGNLIWEYVSGHKAVINDIDVFVFTKVIDGMVQDKFIDSRRLSYIQREVKYYEDYRGLACTSQAKEYYLIDETKSEGIYNFIYYSANADSPSIIINSFDINCTQVGYSIEEDKFYWTPEFEQFINTGKLQLVNILSPSHSAIRLFKKKYELNVDLEPLEIQMCQYCLDKGMSDTNRVCFSDKYAKNFRKYESDLGLYFTMEVDDQVTKFFREEKKLDMDVHRLKSIAKRHEIFEDTTINNMWRGQDLLYYVRNIMGKESNIDIWRKLHYLMGHKNNDYIDLSICTEDVDMLAKLIRAAPKTIENLKGLTLSEQISLMKNLFEKYKEDPIIAISILEKMKFKNNAFDEGDFLLLELSVRKEIVNDTKGKVKQVFGTASAVSPEYADVHLLPIPNLDDL